MSVNGDKVIEHLIEKWGEDKPCPMCGHTTWNANSNIFELPEYTRDGAFPENSFPVVPVTCDNCFTSQMVSAVLLGLVGDGGEENE